MNTKKLINSRVVILTGGRSEPMTAEVQFANGKKAYISVYLNMDNVDDYPDGLATILIHNASENINIQAPGFDDLT